tara:strand:- start:218 stop:550 length:333 start_codon:yes stop_codon:yes gene_type:complete
MKKCIITLTAVAFLYVACSPDETIPYFQQVEAMALPTVGNTPLPPTNRNNPYDYMNHIYQDSLQSTSEVDDEDWDLSTPNATRDSILDQEDKQDTESFAPFSGIKPIQEP